MDSPEALLRPQLQPDGKRSSTSDETPITLVGTENRVQWMIDAIKPRLKAWAKAFSATELSQVTHECLNGTVPDFADAHARSTILPLLDELLPTLVRREGVAALATEDDESPSGTALKRATSSAVADRLATVVQFI